jgi:hypothetical protein
MKFILLFKLIASIENPDKSDRQPNTPPQITFYPKHQRHFVHSYKKAKTLTTETVKRHKSAHLIGFD